MNNISLKVIIICLSILSIIIAYLNFKLQVEKNNTIINLKNELNIALKINSNSHLDCINNDKLSYSADLNDLRTLTKDKIIDKYSCSIGNNRITYKEMKSEINKIEEQINQKYLIDYLYNNYWYIETINWNNINLKSNENFTYFDLSLIDIKKYPFISKLNEYKKTYSNNYIKKGELKSLDITDFNILCKETWYKKNLKWSIQNGISECKLVEIVNGYEINLFQKEIKEFENNLNKDILKLKNNKLWIK